MPIISSLYNPPSVFKNGHFSTIYAATMRTVTDITQQRERITLSDGDFIDLDWSFSKTKTTQLIIIFHGLEGSAKRPYILGTAKVFNEYGIDACAVNLRSCSGEQNTLFKSYHSGATSDVEEIIQHILSTKNYTQIILKGFSLGGNLVLKYLGEQQKLSSKIVCGIAVSVPCFLYGSMLELHKPKNIIYNKRFKKDLIDKLKEKIKQHPIEGEKINIQLIKTLKDFDDYYTSKAHGFKDALDYYTKSSSLQYLKNISIPTLIINAKNDTFLSKECYPTKQAKENPHLFLEIPKYGGHVGFFDKNNIYYTEKRALEFVKSVI
ncbi:YheT family hydrolase [Zhouia sp. PK063]|uniref:YheT family hydrolase n=1 Tax=Zhouia sp. PK063 TaxID=3373602 RepID=UPI0037B01519